MNFYNNTIEEIFKSLKTTSEGLSSSEVKIRKEKYGLNIIVDGKKKSKLRIFLGQFNNLMIILLLVVGILSLIYTIFTDGDYLDPIVIIGTTLVNVFMGYLQESKAEDAVEKLKKYTATMVTVRRDNRLMEVNSKDVVVGDILVLEAGDQVAADARILESYFAKVDEAILTGESNQVVKENDLLSGKKALHEMNNMVFAGTSVVTGKMEAVVVRTGMDTEMGKIAKTLTKSADPITPLEVKVKKISSFISTVAIFLVVFVLAMGVIYDYDVLTVVMLCISMIVASVPECLPIAITATLSIGVSQMAKKKSIVRNMAAIETLGATEIICSDKTGTITTNQMEVMKFYVNQDFVLPKELKKEENEQFFHIMALCNNSTLDKKNQYYGDSLEVALSNYLQVSGVRKEQYDSKYARIMELPFDSNRKMMSTINEINHKNYILTKGGLSSMIDKCSKILINNKVRKITAKDKKALKEAEANMSKDALKVIALGYKELSKLKETDDAYLKEEDKLILVGLIGLKDPARKDVKEAISKCKEAHIRTIMITGDNLDTALAIAKEVGIITSDDEGVEGSSLDQMSTKQLRACIKKNNVFARVSPEHKYMIIEELKRQGKVVAMTGDGVNDAPAMKLASVGVGMGKTGTDVTKNVADIILLDDSFSTIVTAVDEGRRIYDNVVSNVLYNLSSNFTEILIIIIGIFLSQNIILPLHVLYIDLVADTIPSIALAFERASKNNMKKYPNGLNKPIFTPFFLSFLITSVIIETGISMFIYFLFRGVSTISVAQTLALLSIVINEFVFAYNCRSLKEQISERGVFTNKHLNIGIMILLVVQLLVFLTPIGQIFSLEAIRISDFIFVVIANILCFFLLELIKPLLVKLFKDK